MANKKVPFKIKCDEATTKWFESLNDSEAVTTLSQCEKCGLFYKFSLGHKCPVTSSKQSQEASLTEAEGTR